MCPCVKTSHTERGGRELTCFHSTGRSGSVHTHRCSRGRNWVCERKWKRARKGSAGKRPHTPSRNNLPDKENRVTNDTQIDVCVCVVSAKSFITWVTDTGVRAPVVAAVAVLRADVGVAGVSQVAAVFHADLQALSHVHVGHVGGRLTHTHSLVERTHA